MAEDKSKAAPEDALSDQERLAEVVRRVGRSAAAVEAFLKR
jgi:hypothetical protein